MKMDHTTQLQVMLLPLAALAVTIGYLRDQILCFFYCARTKHPMVLFAKNIFNQTLLRSVILRNTMLEVVSLLQNSSQIAVKLASDLRVMIVTSIQGILVTIHQFVYQAQLLFASFFERNDQYKEFKVYLPAIQFFFLFVLICACFLLVDGAGVEVPKEYPTENTPTLLASEEQTKKPVRRRNRRTN